MGENIHQDGSQPRPKRSGKRYPKPTTPGDTTCPIVGIGASAGGLEVFSRILRALPEHVGVAFVLVQHLDPTQESMLTDILSRQSKMPVSEAEDGMPVEPDRVYVMPRGVTMVMRDGAISLTGRPKPPLQVLPIDTFLRSLAETCENKAIGVVVSGTGSDGVLGLGAIKEAGGITFAQDPDSAEYTGMPQAAIDAGVADAVLDPEGIAAELVRIGGHHHEADPERQEAEAPQEIDEEALHQILSLVRKAAGVDFSQYRRTTLVRRISRRMLLENIPTMEEYLRRLQEQPSAVESLYRDILVNMTEFFRDPDALEALPREVFPEILARKGPAEPVRIWIPGCSKGQEAYSILMTLVEFLDGEALRPEVQMFASDVNEHDVEFARAGVYPQGITHEVSAERLARFFVQVPGGYQIDRSIREMCVFAVHDVTKDPPFSKLDLVSFRNVLIYMERPLQTRVLQILHYALEPNGLLLLGSSETTGTESTLFSVVDKKHRIYRRKAGPGKLLAALNPSAGELGFARHNKVAERAPAFDVRAEAEKVVQGGYQPTGILVTSDLDVLEFRGRVGPYLDPVEGLPEFKLQRLIAPGLSSTVEAAIREAASTKAAAKRRGTAPECDGEERAVDVEVVPIIAPGGESYYLVLFRGLPREGAAKPGQTAKRGNKRVDSGAEDPALRGELDEAHEQLKAVISERDAANTDLRAASEKFQSSNEELRTINEEFQTAQEELQSTNEELTTLNDELRNRNTELGRLADDLNNVIEGVEIPILILGTDLRIRRFTPQTEAIVSIVPSDVGRPITDLHLKVDVPDLKDRVHEVLREGVPSQTEVRNVDGRWHSMRIRAYKTGDGAVDGVVIAFIDIDELKHAAEVTEAAREHAEAVIETVREPLITLAADLRVREANDAFYQTFAVAAEETIDRLIYELGDGQWDFPELRSLLEQVLPQDQGFANLVVERDFLRIGYRCMELYARRVREEFGRPSILLAVSDITGVTRRERLSKVLNDVSVHIVSTLDFDQILERVVRESTRVLGAASGAVLVQQDGAWVMKDAYGLPQGLVERIFDEQRLPENVASREVADPVVLGLAEAAGFISDLGMEPDSASVLVVPLLAREERIGFVSFHYPSAHPRFGDDEMAFARRLGTLMSLAFENARLYETQREIAETLQKALLTVPQNLPGIDFGYLYRSASASAAVGGDFYDFFDLDGGRVGVLLGDVSGKGVQAATLTALVKNTIRTLAYENDSPAAIIKKANAVIFKATPLSSFATIIFCILDTASGRLAYCNAGHTRGIIKTTEGTIALLEVSSPLAGAFEDVEFKDGETTLETDDILILYTDGVTEARHDGELLGEEWLVEFIARMGSTPPKKLPEAIFDEVLRYTGGKLSDDVAIVAMARTEKE